MNEEEKKLADQQRKLAEQQRELLKRLQSIGSDLWGASADGALPAEGQKTAQTGDKPQIRAKRASLSVENLWMTTDETIDWTEALAHDRPADGLTDPELWAFFHSMADRVLRGDQEAYAQVLRRINPLADLTPFADGLTMRVPGPDRTEGRFVCREDLIRKYGKTYPAAVGLRIARDLLAVLPVSEVGVTASYNGKVILDITYPRSMMRSAAFRFVDPVVMAENCGGKIEL